MANPISKPPATFADPRARRLALTAISLSFALSGCGSANYGELFESGPTQAGSGASTASVGAIAGSSGLPLSSGGWGAANGTVGLGGGGSAGSETGCAFSCGEGGRAAGGIISGDAGGTKSEAGSGSAPTECSGFAADAKYFPATQHCYLLDAELRNFADAQAHCTELQAHLITLGNEAENDFAWSIHPDEHWIGSKDGRAPKQSGAGMYTWVTNEPFDYRNWSSEQPNASQTDCVEGGTACYEHCAFQWKGGQHDNQWNDRYCMHTIASICEWDRLP